MNYVERAASPRRRGLVARLLFGAALPAIAIAFAMPAHAAEDGASADSADAAATDADKDIILVVGERLETNLMKIPMAIQDIPAERLQDLKINSVKDLNLVAPSFTVSRSYQGTPQYSIRGIGFNAINMSASPTVTLYQDDIAYPYPFTQLGPVFDLGGAQVLKGPQGTVFGRNTTAGVINLTSNQPTEEYTGSLAIDVGNYETFNLEGFLSGRVSPWLKARLAFRTEQSMKGWQRSESRPEDRLGEVHNTGARLILAADPSPGLDITLTLSGWKNESDTRAMQAIGLTPGADQKYGNGAAALSTNDTLREFVGAPCPADDTECYNGGYDFELEEYVYPKDHIREWDNRTADWSPAHKTSYRHAAVRGYDPDSFIYNHPFFQDVVPGRADGIGNSEALPGKLNENTSFWSTSLDIGYDISDGLRLISLSNFQKLSRDSLQDVSGAPYEVLIQNPKGSIQSWSQELQLKGDTGPVKWSVGGYYGKDKIEENIRSNIFNNSNSQAVRRYFSNGANVAEGLPGYDEYIEQVSDDDRAGAFRSLRDVGQFDVETKSLLANAEWAVTDTLTLSGGARYTWDRLEFRGCTKDVNGNALLGAHSGVLYLIERAYGKAAIPDAPAKPNECLTMYQDGTRIDDEKGEVPHFERGEVHNIQKESNFSWRAALSWRPVPELMAYASASRGYKSGVNPLNTANSEKQDAPVKQEELTAYEAGARLDIDRFRLGVGGFYYDYRDKQLSGYYKDPVFTTLAALVNVPKSKAWGIEGDLSVEPVRGITLFGNALYLKTKILETDPTAVNELGRLASYNGSGFGVPKWALSGGASFNTSLGEALGLRATVNYRWQSKTIGMRSTQFAYEEFGEKIPEQSSPKEHYYDIKAYGLLNANITLFDGDDNDWEFSIWGRNLNQTDYAIGVKSNATTIFRIPGDPRTFGATFRVNF